MKTLILITLALSTSAAFAEFEKHKPTQIDFNQMIENNQAENSELQKKVHENGFGNRPAADIKDPSKRVADFLDVEVGVAGDDETPKVSDRRYN